MLLKNVNENDLSNTYLKKTENKSSYLMERSAISCDLCIEGFLDERAPLDFCFALFDLSHDPVHVLQLVAALPEDFGIF